MERFFSCEKAAETMKITAPDLKELGIVDEMVSEVKAELIEISMHKLDTWKALLRSH